MSSPSSNNETPQPRQKPGLACEECRRRKLRCDRQQPQCGVCADSGAVCTITSPRPPRGPRKGHLKALRARVAVLEGRLSQMQGGSLPDDQILDFANEQILNSIADEDHLQLPCEIASGIHLETRLQDPFLYMKPIDSLISSPDTTIPILMREELDQLYFDRVHVFTPMLHQRRHFVWSRQDAKNEVGTCLQYAMWTLAASFSAQFQHIVDSLYRDTRQMLEALELKDTETESIGIQQVQAWILLAIYEFMRSSYRRGWMSAGHSFRLVQLMRLYEIDKPNNTVEQRDWIEVEEKRRTFWVAYSLDRIVSMRNGWPLTLNEVITTRLPAPEIEFQSGQPVVMGFLSEEITSSNQQSISAFTECIILTTICGRALSHRHQSLVENLYADVMQSFWERHQWINATLTQRMQLLSLKYPPASQNIDPMLLFTNMLAQATVMCLYTTMEYMVSETDEDRAVMADYEKLAVISAQETVSLARTLAQLSYFKIHPFTPIPLFLCADFLNTYKELDESLDLQVQDILQALRGLTSVNSLADSILRLFELEGAEGSLTASSVNSTTHPR